jgi:hypothetical protein
MAIKAIRENLERASTARGALSQVKMYCNAINDDLAAAGKTFRVLKPAQLAGLDAIDAQLAAFMTKLEEVVAELPDVTT